jgi:hypothetical protein
MCDIVIFLPVLQQSSILKLERTGQLLLDEGLKLHNTEKLVEAMGRLLLQDTTGCPAHSSSTSSEAKPERTGLLIDWLVSVEPELVGSCTSLQVSPNQSPWLFLHSVQCNLF